MSCHHVTFYPFDRLTPFLWVGWMITVKTSTLGTWRPIVFNVLRLMNKVQMTKIC